MKTVFAPSPLPTSLMSAPLTTPASLTRLRTCLAVGCGVGLLLYAGAVLRRHLASPRPPPRVTCPMADNTIALLRHLHDGPFRFGDPTPFAMAARAEATRRIRRQQRERRRLRRRMRSQLHPTKSPHHQPTQHSAGAAEASVAISNVFETTNQKAGLSVPMNPSPAQQEQHVPDSERTSSGAATATVAKDRGDRAAAAVLSRRARGALLTTMSGGLTSASAVASFCAVESDADDNDQREGDGYIEGTYATNVRLVEKRDGVSKMTSSEALLPSSSLSMGRSCDSDYSDSQSTSTSTTSGSSYDSRISTPSFVQSEASSEASHDSAGSLLVMTTGSVTSPDGIPWVKATLDNGSVRGGDPRPSHNVPQITQQPSQRHHSPPASSNPAGSYSNLSQHIVSGSNSNPQLSSHPHSMTGAMAAQGGRYPVQPLWFGISSPAPSMHAFGGTTQLGANTTPSCTFGGSNSHRSPEVAYAATSASMPGVVPSLLTGGGGDEELHRYVGSAYMYGPPLFSTEMDVTDALAELRSSACCSGDRYGNSCLGGGASSTTNATSSPCMSATVASSGGGIMALIGSSMNATSFQQQQLGMSSSMVHHRSHHHHHPQQASYGHHSSAHPRGQGYFSGTSIDMVSASATVPTLARRAVHYPSGGGGSGRSQPRPPSHYRRSSSGYHHVSSRTSFHRSVNGSPVSSQLLPEALSVVSPGYASDGATGESTASAANDSFMNALTATPISPSSSILRRSMADDGRAHHSSGHGKAHSNASRFFRSMDSVLRYLGLHRRHRGGGRLRRWCRRCRRQVRRRVTVSCATIKFCVRHVWLAMRYSWHALDRAGVRGGRWIQRRWRESTSAASAQVLAILHRPSWSLARSDAMAAADGGCSAAVPALSSEKDGSTPTHVSPGVDAATDAAAAAEARRGGLLMTDTADEAINKIVQLLEPTPGRVPTVAVIRAPLGYDVSTDAASLWKALHFDSSSSEEGLIDIIIMEELKTGPLPPAQAKAAAAAAGPSTPVLPCVGTSNGERTAATALPGGNEGDVSSGHPHNSLSFASSSVEPAMSLLPQRRQPPEPSASSTSGAATAAARAQAQLRISFEIYPAHLFYSLIFRAAVLQEKDWALRRAAAELFGGSAEIEGSGTSLGTSTAANSGAGGNAGATLGSPLSLAHALSFTFGVPGSAGECNNSNNAVTSFSHHPHHGAAAVVGSNVGLESYCLSPLSSGHFCRMPVSPKLTTPAPHVGLIGGGGAAGVGFTSASPGTAGGTVASPVTLPPSALSPGAVTSSPQVVVRLSERYSFPALPPQMVMSPLLGTQSGLGVLSAGLSGSAYGAGGSALAGVGTATGVSGTAAAGAAAMPGSGRRIISEKEVLFYIHVLRTPVGDGVTTTAVPSSRASEVEDVAAGIERAAATAMDVQRSGASPAKRSPRTPRDIRDAVPVHCSGEYALEDNDDDSEDLTLLELRQREVESQVLLRYRFRVFQQGSRSRKALDAIVLYAQDHVEPWHEEAKAMLRALPATKSFQALSLSSTPLPQCNESIPAQWPSESTGRLASLGGSGEAATGFAAGRLQRRSCRRPAGLTLLSLGTAPLVRTPELDRMDSCTTAASSGSVQLPAWAMEVLIRRESMRETLVRDLKEKAFRVCAIPLPDMRVHCILPPAVPRYVTAHARGFPLSRTFAEEVLSQQRALQLILLQREEENQRVIAARIRQEQRQKERRERRRRERRTREEVWRRGQQERQQRKGNLTSRGRMSGDGESLKERLTGTMNPAALVSRVASMVKHASVGAAGRGCRGLGNVRSHESPSGSDGVCKACSRADAACWQGASEAAVPLGESGVCTHSPTRRRRQYRHDYSTSNGGVNGTTSSALSQNATPEGNAQIGSVLSQDKRDRVGCGEAELRDATTIAAVPIDNAQQHQCWTHEPSSSGQVCVMQRPPGLQSVRASHATAAAMSAQISPPTTEVDINFLGGSSSSVSIEAASDASRAVKAVNVSVSSYAAEREPHSSECVVGCDKGGNSSSRVFASVEALISSPPAPTSYTSTAQTMPLTPPKVFSVSPPPQPLSSVPENGLLSSLPTPPPQAPQGDRGGKTSSSSAARPISLASASTTRNSHWTAVHTATNANTCVTPPPTSSATSGAGSPAALVDGSGNSGGHATNSVSHVHAQVTSASTSNTLQSHLSTCSATTRATMTSLVSGFSSTTPSFSGMSAAADFHTGTTSTSERDFPSMSLLPPPLPLPPSPSPLPTVSTSFPPAPGAGIPPSSPTPFLPDAPTVVVAVTRNASLDASAGGHANRQDANVPLSLLPQQPHTGQSHRLLQSPALPITATSLLNVEDTMYPSVGGDAVQSSISNYANTSSLSNHHNHLLERPDDGGVPAASLTTSSLTTPNNGMYGTLDTCHSHSVVMPQAVLLRQQVWATAAPLVSSSSMRPLTPPHHRATVATAAPFSAAATVAGERGARAGEPHNGACTSDPDVRSTVGMCSNAASQRAVGASAGATEGSSQPLQLPSQQHLQASRSGSRRTGSGLLPYTYSADSVSSMYGTTHYPLYQYPEGPNSAASAGYIGVAPPTTSMPGAAVMGGSGGAPAVGLAGSNHAGTTGLYTYNSAGYIRSHALGAGATGVTQAYASAGSSIAFSGCDGGDHRAVSSVGGVGRLENWSSPSQSPHMPDSLVDMNTNTIAPPSLPHAQDTHMNRLKQCNKLLSDLLGVAGGPMRSGISFYYTYGDATALLYNASIRAPCDENILEMLEQQQWAKQQEQLQLLQMDCGSGACSDSGGAADGSMSGGDKIASDSSSGCYSKPGSASGGTGASHASFTFAGIGASSSPSSTPQQRTTPQGSGIAAGGGVSTNGQGVRNACEGFSATITAAAPASEDEGCSYLDYGDLAGLQDTMDALEAEQIEAQRARNTHLYSIFEHLHHAYHDTLLEATDSGSAKSVGVSSVPAAAASGSLYAGLIGGVRMEYFFPSTASAAGAASEGRHTASPHGVGHVAVPGRSTPSPGVLYGGEGTAEAAGLTRWRQRLWSSVCGFVVWVGSVVGLTPKPGGNATGVGGTTDRTAATQWPSPQPTPGGAKLGFDLARLAEYFPGERIVTFGDEWCIASRLDRHNGHFGLSPLQVWMATRYSRRFAGEVYLMDVIAAGGDPYYPAVRVLDEIVAHAVLYYHNHSLRDFVEDLEAELGLVYAPQTLWGRRALGLPDNEAEVQELDGLLYTATRRRQDRSRRQRAQRKDWQRRRCSDGAASASVKDRAATSRIPPPATASALRSTATDRLHTDGGPPSTCATPAADAVRDGERKGGLMVGSRRDGRCSSSPQTQRMNGATTQGGSGASDARTVLPGSVSDGVDAPSVAVNAATMTPHRPTPLQQHNCLRRHDSDRLEDEEMAEYTWIQLQGKDQEEDEEVFYGATAAAAVGFGGGDINIAPHVYDAVMEREMYDERMLLRELDYLKEFLVDNRNVLSSAMLTTAGSNSLEAVFGVPATVFPFLLCARESVPFIASIFESLSYHYGPLTYDSFSKYTYDVYHRDRLDVLRHTPRMFRMVNKSRRGCITYEELCRWMARKLSCGNNVQPNRHLVATSMSLRLPLALVAESRDEWDAYRCVLKSLSDGEDEEY
ncbi:hypothetical protein Q4I28_001081 [Leishmania naiffi]|uniref:Uncharacterized protein n=1 Tax=Leishmania naiffi TaxID=5678 RepID=A0AAW3C572_9TRYP